MTPSEELRLFLALRGDFVARMDVDCVPRREFEQLALDDVRRITPAINDMLEQAESRGYLRALLERWAALEGIRAAITETRNPQIPGHCGPAGGHCAIVQVPERDSAHLASSSPGYEVSGNAT